MDTLEKVLLIVLGIALGVGLTFVLTRPKSLAQSYSVAKTYENIEEWEIIKDEDTGRVKGVRAHRSAKET
jgi:hypothetical protein